MTLALAALAASGCGQPAPRDPLEPYPLTGRVREYTFTVTELDWEVAPGAIYSALAYNGQIPGPVIDVNAGDVVRVTVENKTDHPRSIHTHLVRYLNESDGSGESVVPPGGSRTFEWEAVHAGTFPYHDHGDMSETGVARGLYGALVVRPPKEPLAKEFIAVLSDLDADFFKSMPGSTGADGGTEGEHPHGFMHVINGKAYAGSTPTFEAKVGDRVRWRVVSIGKEFHTFHIHGHRWNQDGRLEDNVTLGPAQTATFSFSEDNPGRWMYHCHVPGHMAGGMMGWYVVSP